MSTVYVENLAVKMTLETCPTCGVMFGLTAEYELSLQNNQEFWCPNGHSLSFTGQTEYQKLQNELAEAKRNADNLRAARDAAREQAAHEQIERRKLQTRHRHLITRVATGVCPCCRRQFPALQAHIRQEHPDYVCATREDKPRKEPNYDHR